MQSRFQPLPSNVASTSSNVTESSRPGPSNSAPAPPPVKVIDAREEAAATTTSAVAEPSLYEIDGEENGMQDGKELEEIQIIQPELSNSNEGDQEKQEEEDGGDSDDNQYEDIEEEAEADEKKGQLTRVKARQRQPSEQGTKKRKATRQATITEMMDRNNAKKKRKADST